jgi:hypothetical protein
MTLFHFFRRIFFCFIIILSSCSNANNKYVHSYESCGFGEGTFTLHKDGSATHHRYGTNTVKGAWSADGDLVIVSGIPDYSGTYILDGESGGIALKSSSTGMRFCSEY